MSTTLPAMHPTTSAATPVERLDLNFRAEPSPSRLLGIPVVWWLWCVLGLALGYGAWWTGRQVLARRLSDQLATAQSPSDAFLALEGLLMLDAEATLEIVRGLQHPNSQIARTAYRTLDAQISGWTQLEASIAAARMRSLSQRLSELPETTPPDNLILASSLASRIFSMCLELNDPQLAPVMTACELVFQRIGNSSRSGSSTPTNPTATSDSRDVVTVADLQAIEQQVSEINELRPPPPLAQATSTLEDSLDESQYTQPTASSVAPLAPREELYSSSSTPTAHVQFLNVSTRPRTAQLAAGGTSLSLSDVPPEEQGQAFSLSDERVAAEPQQADAPQHALSEQESQPPMLESQLQPTLIRGPASVQAAVTAAPSLKSQSPMQGFDQLEIDQLVRLLASVQPQVAQQAALALRAQGFPDERLALASELATALPEQQMELLQQIAIRSDLDPRPWLLWMAEDGQPDVRRQAIGLLSSMASDLQLQRDLKRLLAQERDERVAHSIRQVLLAR